MIPTRSQLVTQYMNASITTEARYFQRWSTKIVGGKVWITLYDKDGHADGYEPCPELDGFGLPSHEIEDMSRIDWYACRHKDDDAMQLFSIFFGSSDVIPVVHGAIRRFFDGMFRDNLGYLLRASEAEAAEREADDIFAVNTACYR